MLEYRADVSLQAAAFEPMLVRRMDVSLSLVPDSALEGLDLPTRPFTLAFDGAAVSVPLTGARKEP